MQITKRFSWHCSHRLNFHEGLCYNLHGHTYKMDVTVSGNINMTGMVADFHWLKGIVEGLIVKNFDHACIFGKNLDEADKELFDWCIKFNQKTCVLPKDFTTAESMAEYFHRILSNVMPDDIKVESIKVWETDTAYAEEKNVD